MEAGEEGGREGRIGKVLDCRSILRLLGHFIDNVDGQGSPISPRNKPALISQLFSVTE